MSGSHLVSACKRNLVWILGPRSLCGVGGVLSLLQPLLGEGDICGSRAGSGPTTTLQDPEKAKHWP